MNVRELILALQTFNPEAIVLFDDDEMEAAYTVDMTVARYQDGVDPDEVDIADAAYVYLYTYPDEKHIDV